MTRDGDVETSIASFIARYGTNNNGNNCNPTSLSTTVDQDSCLIFPHRLDKATQTCNTLRQLGETCQYDFDIEKMYQQCMESVCATDNEQSICKFVNVFRNQCRKE